MTFMTVYNFPPYLTYVHLYFTQYLPVPSSMDIISCLHLNEFAMNTYTFLTLQILISSAWRDIFIPQVFW